MEADAAMLRRYLADTRQVPDIGPDGLAWSLEADWQARVVLAWGELERDMPGRLRPCANDECRQFLIDRSRAGTARWCSMSGCGNRMKARRHYSRTRS
jgi:predicted RNA-binding Zn ribbon-like protein